MTHDDVENIIQILRGMKEYLGWLIVIGIFRIFL